jgi:DNA adenine methylase
MRHASELSRPLRGIYTGDENIPNQDMGAGSPALLDDFDTSLARTTPQGGLLKWIGNKQRFASRIVNYFPSTFGTYYEPFIGSGAVLATLAPKRAIASDSFRPLIEIWQRVRDDPETVKTWYAERFKYAQDGNYREQYESIKASYNASPNGADLLFLCRSCYGGVVRFRKADGFMSTPCGIHKPIKPSSFAKRVDDWHTRISNTSFDLIDYRSSMRFARRGDLVYCDPPYIFTQRILYGAQDFSFQDLITEIVACKRRGVLVVLSIDGNKRSGKERLDLDLPAGLFAREVFIAGGASMLKRFQSRGISLDREHVAERLLLTF